MIYRRAFVLGALAVAARFAGAAADAAGGVPRIGVLAPRTRPEGSVFIDPFVQGLRDLGWEDGKNLRIEFRWADGRADRLPELAAELVQLKVDVILAASTSAVVAARTATATIPIVMGTVGDPVGLGLAATLSRPAGNVTGLSYAVGLGTISKQLELLKEIAPGVTRAAVLGNPANPSHALSARQLTDLARSLNVELQLLEVRGLKDLDIAVAAMVRQRAGAVVVLPDSVLAFHRARLQDLVTKHRLPAVYGLREHAEAGGLLSYGVDVRDNFRRCASYVDRILKGAKPADLPIEQPTRFELVINLKTAKALGLTIPPSLLARADQVIE